MIVKTLAAPSCNNEILAAPSSRPHTAATPEPDELLTSPHKLMTHSPREVKEEIRRAHKRLEGGDGDERGREEVAQLIYHTSDFTVTAVVDNPKVGGQRRWGRGSPRTPRISLCMWRAATLLLCWFLS